MSERKITIVHLYPRSMNIYGDAGNVLAVKRRLEWYGYTPKIVSHNETNVFPSECDILIGGGGQDSGQLKIMQDLQIIAPKLQELAENGTPQLMVCGLYQLYGLYFKTYEDNFLDGIGVFDIYTLGKTTRLIGNITTESDRFGKIVGYENHSGQTFFDGKKTLPLAKVLNGVGNNETDKTEGAIYKNTIGTYLHGSILPKNPAICDFLIEQATINKYGEFAPTSKIPAHVLKTTENARKVAFDLPR
ncbi:MAG: glutamine amidotransferase [Bifidobacteriaceae bacterium]|jgi:CobQ-like glutamine amidotransferase family enzyme|nr:glutamine amidotransferase [Bifidobacteriaceae bacterium]